MSKKLLIAAVALLAAGAVLLGVGTMIDRDSSASDLGIILGENQTEENREAVSSGENTVSDDNTPSGENAAQLDLDPFSRVDLSVVAADVRFEEGEAYGLRYRLHPDEAVVQAKVEGETLCFFTKTREGASLSGDWEVVVIIPRDARLADLSAATVSGDIRLSDRAMEALHLATTSGAIDAAAVTADEVQAVSTSGHIAITDLSAHSVNATSTSGDISLTGTADSLELGTTSGDLSLTGTADSLNLGAVSGNCTFSGNLAGKGSVDTVSGDIDVTVADAGAKASTLGEITWNGQSQGQSFQREGRGSTLTLGSVSGDIRITTE